MPEIEQKIKQLEKAAASVETFSTQVLNIDTIQRQPKQVQFWTGFPNFETFLQMTYWRGGATDMTLNFNPNKKSGPERKLTLLNEFFLTLVRLKVGLLTEDLAHRYNISTSSVSSFVTSWVTLMFTDLKLICSLPSNNVTSYHQSTAMKTFNDVRVILDCTELFVQNPHKLDARKQLFSSYKHHITYKFLIGLSPQMGITYVSRMYGGRASDKYITSNSTDLLENLDSNKGSVMADTGFLVEGILNEIGVKLHIPAFKGTDRPQLSEQEILESESISAVRIHVERAIQRIKTYHILDEELKLSMKHVAEQVFTVCAFLVNFQAPIKSEWYQPCLQHLLAVYHNNIPTVS